MCVLRPKYHLFVDSVPKRHVNFISSEMNHFLQPFCSGKKTLNIKHRVSLNLYINLQYTYIFDIKYW